jgi:DNA-binding transcriptional ArsR family regulator
MVFRQPDISSNLTRMAKRTSRKDLKREAGLPEIFHALGDPIRLSIVKQIHHSGEMPCGAFDMDMPKSTLSHHFRVLREAGILGTRSEGTSIMNFLLAEELSKRFPKLLNGILGNLG